MDASFEFKDNNDIVSDAEYSDSKNRSFGDMNNSAGNYQGQHNRLEIAHHAAQKNYGYEQ